LLFNCHEGDFGLVSNPIDLQQQGAKGYFWLACACGAGLKLLRFWILAVTMCVGCCKFLLDGPRMKMHDVWWRYAWLFRGSALQIKTAALAYELWICVSGSVP
jgi:hypothetical protein